jgi:hypothetical protein
MNLPTYRNIPPAALAGLTETFQSLARAGWYPVRVGSHGRMLMAPTAALALDAVDTLDKDCVVYFRDSGGYDPRTSWIEVDPQFGPLAITDWSVTHGDFADAVVRVRPHLDVVA